MYVRMSTSRRKRRNEGENADNQVSENVPILNGVINANERSNEDRDNDHESNGHSFDDDEDDSNYAGQDDTDDEDDMNEEYEECIHDWGAGSFEESDEEVESKENENERIDDSDPLQVALRKIDGTASAIMELIDLNPTALEQKDGFGNYPLHLACNHCHCYEALMHMMEIFPMAAHHANNNGKYPLHLAIENYQSDTVVMKLIELYPMALREKDSKKGMYPLHLVCNGVMHSVAQCHCILQNPNIEVNIRDGKGKTPLHYACECRYTEVVEELLRHPDIDVNAVDDQHETPLHRAFDEVHFSENQLTRCVRVLQLLLDHPFILINEKDGRGQTALDYVETAIPYISIRNMDLFEKQDILYKFIEIGHMLIDFETKRRWNAYQCCFNAVGDSAVLIDGQDK